MNPSSPYNPDGTSLFGGLPVWMVALIVAALLFLIWVAVTFNRFVRLSNIVRESWADVDVALKRRYDLIPNLVETVKAYAKYESELFQRLAEAREKAIQSLGEVSKQARDQQALEEPLRLVMARAEAYPELKASAHFMQLQEELANTEDRIAAARRFYNANVRTYNTLLETFPTSILAGGRTRAEFFEVGYPEQRDPVPVTLNS